MKKLIMLLAALTFMAGSAEAASVAVKKAKDGTCLAKTDADFAKTKQYKSYKTIEACVASGGHVMKK